jgi:hypothetical protein
MKSLAGGAILTPLRRKRALRHHLVVVVTNFPRRSWRSRVAARVGMGNGGRQRSRGIACGILRQKALCCHRSDLAREGCAAGATLLKHLQDVIRLASTVKTPGLAQSREVSRKGTIPRPILASADANRIRMIQNLIHVRNASSPCQHQGALTASFTLALLPSTTS